MSCPNFKEGIFAICVAPDAIHVPSISEMEKYCFRSWYGTCPNLASQAYLGDADTSLHHEIVGYEQRI